MYDANNEILLYAKFLVMFAKYWSTIAIVLVQLHFQKL